MPTINGVRPASLRRRLNRAFASMLLLALLGALTSTFVVTELVHASRASAVEIERESAMTTRLRQAMEQEQALAHMVIDSGGLAVDAFQAADADMSALLGRAARTYDQTTERALVAKLQGQWDQTFAFLRSTPAGTTAPADHNSVVPIHQSLADSVDGMQGTLDRLAATSLRPADRQLTDERQAERLMLVLLYSLLALSLAGTVYFARRTRRDVLGPIGRFREAVGHVSAGSFDHRVTIDRDDEFGELATTFNAMADAVDCQQRKLTEQLYGRAQLAAIVESSDQAILSLSPDMVVTTWNPGAERLYGYTAEEAVGRRVDFLLAPTRTVADTILRRVVAGERIAAHETTVRIKDGSIIPISVSASPIVDDAGTLVGVCSIAEDIRARTALEARLHYQAFHDPLTGLANRTLLKDRLEHALARQARSGAALGVLLLDLDDFKSINDSLGHRAGDELLVSVAERLRGCTREADTLARLGGDEFAVLLEDLPDRGEAVQVAERIIESLSSRFTYEGRAFPVSASVGLAFAEGGTAPLDDVLRDADVAMYLTKSTTKGGFTVFEPGMHLAVKHRLQLKADLAKAMGTNELCLHYQPIIDLPSGNIVGVEALARWNHPERGMVSPADFIPVAEESGLIVPLGLWVLETACRQAKAWREATTNPLRVSVNVSGRQLEDRRFVDEVAHVLDRVGFDPTQLVLEITETVLVSKAGESLDQLRSLKALGVQLAIDDFGTGYSSLSSLQLLPVDILKIDRSFIAHLDGDDEQAGLARAVLSLGRTLQMETVAEGVESDSQAEELRKLDCNMAQGYFFARPADATRVSSLLLEAPHTPPVRPEPQLTR